MSDTPFSRGSRAAPPVLTLGDPVPLSDRVDNRVLIPPVEGPPPRPPGDHIQALDGRTMGTSWSVRAIGPRGLTEAALREAIERELATVVALFSPWEPTSEISRFNAAPPGMWSRAPIQVLAGCGRVLKWTFFLHESGPFCTKVDLFYTK